LLFSEEFARLLLRHAEFLQHRLVALRDGIARPADMRPWSCAESIVDCGGRRAGSKKLPAGELCTASFVETMGFSASAGRGSTESWRQPQRAGLQLLPIDGEF
jgi:hypothetical protein